MSEASNRAHAMTRSATHHPVLVQAAAVLARWRYPLLALVALSQAAVLAYMVAGREWLLDNGRVIELKVQPVDPRDLFRGDYVTLAYDISQLPRQLIAGGLRRGERIYVRLAQDEKGSWQAVAAGRTPAQAGSSAGGVVLMGHVRYAVQPMTDAATAHIWVAYGIEKFFVPEGTGREIEAEVRASDVMAHVAVASDGTAALKGLTVAGERIEMPPLFPK